MNLFKDIKENSSINSLGSKIKNISQTNWLPETKEILASAATSLANNLSDSNPPPSQPQSPRPAQRINRQKSDLNSVNSRAPSTSPSKLYPQNSISNHHHHQSRDHSEHRAKYEEDEPVYETSKKLPQIPILQSRNPEQIRAPISRNPSYRSRSPDTPTDDPNKIDPLQYTALVDTNQALKAELQRLSFFETKCKQLEKEVQNTKALKETNENLEKQIQNLLEYREKCEKLEQDLKNNFKLKENFEILTDENINLTNKIKDLDRLVEENDLMIRDLRQKEIQTKKELDFLKNSNLEKNDQKILALEQTNKLLETELESLKEQQRNEREKLKEKMNLLNSKQHEKLKKFEHENKQLELELNNSKKEIAETNTLKDLNLKYEDEIEVLKCQLRDKKIELEDIMKQRDIEISNYLEKLKILNDENLNLCNQFSSNSMSKDDELNKLSKKISDDEKELSILRQKIQKMQSMEKEISDLGLINKKNEDTIQSLRLEGHHLKQELDDMKSLNQQLKHELTNECLKNENLAADYALLKLEMNKIESYRNKCEHLEKELDDLKRIKFNKINEYETTNRKFSETSDKYEYEIKILNTQINSLQNDLKLKEQEFKQMEKLLENERFKTNALIRQVDELKSSNTDLTMQLSDSKRRLVSLDLLTEECNQLRKNLTLMTIESESKKAEVTTLNSQIGILENTLKSLREANEKQSNYENNYEATVYELRKKQEDLKKLQQVHESVKKEQMDTIELLEEKLKDVEKKTELQALKHEEILLELESIRARRERLLPLCPNCSSQTYPMYQPMTQPITNPQPSQNQSQSQSPKPHYVPYVHPSGQLLSISIPQQSLMSPLISPLHQLQAHHLSQLQVITLPGKQSVTVECQTSPPHEVKKDAFNFKQVEHQNIEKYSRYIEKDKFTRSTQTYELEKTKIYTENKCVNTNFIEYGTKSIQTNQISETKQVKPIMKNEGIYVNIFDEIKRNSSTQTTPVMPKVYDDKNTQCDEKDLGLVIKAKEKYYLYLCKYNYDPNKSSPNQNPSLELPLKTGDYLFILNDKDEDGFLNGELLNGRRGLVPSNFVERIKIDTSKILEAFPKEVLASPKLADMLSSYDLNLGLILTQYQEQIQKLQSQPIVAPKQTIISKNDKQVLLDSKNDEIVKIGLPYPSNLKVEKRSDKSIFICWDAPTAPLPLDQSIENDTQNNNNNNDLKQNVEVTFYNLYLNNELHSVVNGNDDRIAIFENIDLTVPNRISIQANAGKDRMSKPQECTLLFGSNRSFAPSNLAIHNLTQTSAIVSWWPSSSQFSHVISIDSIEHRTLKPGIYRFKLSGLLPDTSHFLTITAQIHPNSTELNSSHSASLEFRTLASRSLASPSDLTIEKDPSENDTFILSWNPVVNSPNQQSNGISVGGYSIYLDGTRVHQILNPIASSVSLSSKLLNGAKNLTVRTLSLDGNSESKDSETIKISKNLLDELRKKVSLSEPPSQIVSSAVQPPSRPKPIQSQPEPKKSQIISQMPKVADANRKKNTIVKQSIDNETDLYENNRVNPLPVSNNTLNAKKKTSRQGSPNSVGGGPTSSKSVKTKSKSSKNYRVFMALFDYDPLKMSPNTDSCQEELPFKEGQLIKIFGEQDSDGFYYGESNGRVGFIPCNMVSEVQMDDHEVANKMLDTEDKSKMRKSSISQKSSGNNKSTLKSTGQTRTGKSKESQFVPINKYSKVTNMIALYDYDPQSLSPNVDADSELPFKTGQIITVYDDMDEDGFFMAELNGKRGLVPSNFLQPLDQTNQYATGDKK
ncbi:unnamed protein product [Brachionus calyciflorus]|uniref:RIMS-binding protein 2 n=1 Tax=Brachionus calyciflorus TaxID=104777 RepID=A0A813M2X4_9BILA|nr:unnamed protein product [Brachionus calyciflorus]